MEEALALDESREVAYEGQLYVWRGNELFRRNADGSLALVDSVVETREDETGQKWLTQDSEGNVLIQVSLRVWATINFEYNSAEILSDSEDVLQAFAQALLSPALSDKNLLIAGHTDNIGGDEFNLKLSRARASSVADWLAGVGVSPERLILTAYGSQVPVADNGTPEGQAQNRRVEFVLLPGKSS
jgi:outer membrane protein OmpA-like peptidoglycan-associated protein